MTSWNEKHLPAVIAEKIEDESFQTDDIGRSNSEVLLFPDKVL